MSERMTTKEAANFLGYKEGTLHAWRCAGIGPPFFQMGPKSVRYDRAQLQKWMSERLVVPSVRHTEGKYAALQTAS